MAPTLAWALLLAALAAFGLYSVVGLGRGSVDGFMNDWLSQGIQLGAAGFCVRRALTDRGERLAWLAVACGVAVSAGGDLWYAFAYGDAEPAFPSLSDAFYLAFYPCMYAAVLLLLRSRVRRFHASLWLDGVIGGLGVATITAALLLQPILDSTGGGRSAVLVNLAYPAGDLLLLALLMVGCALLGWRPGAGWLAVAAGLALTAVADSVYLFQAAKGTYELGGALDFAWPLSAVLYALASRRPASAAAEADLHGRWLLVVPSLCTIAATGVLIFDHFTRTSVVAVVLAGLTLGGALLRTALTFRDVRSLADSRRQALTDDLTGLANRRAFYERVDAALTSAGPDEPLALLVIDLDHFKELNDTLGHLAGDRLLRLVGPRLRDAVPSADTVARLGGDEFAVLLTTAAAADEAQAAAHAIRVALERSFDIDEVTVRVEASVGIALHPAHGREANVLLQHADIAMYQAKEARSGAELYDAGRDSHSRERLILMGELRDALEREELVVYYQPKADLSSGRVTGAEALVRWQHPARGLLAPQEFLPMAEQTGLMRPLTLYVLERALRQTRAWHDAGRPLSIAVNLAVPNLLDREISADVARLLAATGIDASYLELEITENVVMADPVRTIEVLVALRELGVGLSLDDFGTGYSSLAYLKKLAIDELKIDKSFVMQMADDEDDATIVRSTVDLARSLNLRVVAEGVEDERAWRALEAMGCEVAQGFFLSKPVPPAEFDAWLAEWSSRDAPGSEDLGEWHVPDEAHR